MNARNSGLHGTDSPVMRVSPVWVSSSRLLNLDHTPGCAMFPSSPTNHVRRPLTHALSACVAGPSWNTVDPFCAAKEPKKCSSCIFLKHCITTKSASYLAASAWMAVDLPEPV